MTTIDKKRAVNFFLKEGFLISPDLVDNIPENFNFSEFVKITSTKIQSKDKPILLNKDLFFVINKSENNLDINWIEFEKSRALLEKGKNGKIYETFLDILGYDIFEDKKNKLNRILDEIKEPEAIDFSEIKIDPNVLVLESYNKKPSGKKVKDFVSYFRFRYEYIRKILQNRPELDNIMSINRIINKKDRDKVSLIGLVISKDFTKNGNILLKVEDLTGIIDILINKNKEDLFEVGKNIVLDEVVGINGIVGNKIVFVNSVVFPDIQVNKEMKKCLEEVYVAFISDLHVGSNMFLSEEFSRFIKWIRGEYGNFKQRKMASKVNYLFILGDLVDGVGIYPDQENELLIKDVINQYRECARLLNEVPKHIKIVICPGNHDALRISEPQPILNEKYASAFYDLKNVTLVSNPSLVNVHSSENFSGFDILLYHGYSFDYYVSVVDSIRNSGGYDRADLIMKFLLQKRHLAPSHSSTLYVADSEEDPLIIKKVPDFFATGHVHKASVSNYKNVTMICGSCWQSKTSFQEKVGHNPEPARVPVINLKTREIKLMKF